MDNCFTGRRDRSRQTPEKDVLYMLPAGPVTECAFTSARSTRKRCYDVTLSRQEGSTMHHLANAHSVTGPAGSIYKTSFSSVWQDRSRRPVKQLSIG